VDCRTARLLLDFARPLTTELEAGEAAALEEHLADCAECGALAQVERRFDDRVAVAMRAVAVPDALPARILTRLAAARSHSRRRHLLKASASLAAAAAVVFVVVYLGFGRHKPVVITDPNEVWLEVAPPGDSAEVANWFKERYHRSVAPPPQFDYRFLAFAGQAEFKDQRVPLLLFQREVGRAYVYVLSERDFDVTALRTGGPPYKVLVLRHPDHPGVAYLVAYTSDDLTPFLKEKRDQAAMLTP
jgi:hypothetical protein